MKDIIYRDDAVALVIKAIHGTDNKEIQNYLMDGLRKQMWSLPSADDKWIPVSKKLPDIGMPVLVSDGVYVWEDELQEDYEDGKTVYWWDSQCSFDFNDTAWQLKPMPYKGGGNE